MSVIATVCALETRELTPEEIAATSLSIEGSRDSEIVFPALMPNLESLELDSVLVKGAWPAMPKLRELTVALTEIDSIPEHETLLSLTLDRAGVSELPDGMRELRALDMVGGSVVHLPEGLDSIVTIEACGSALESVPEDWNPLKLEYLDISETKVESLPDRFESLTVLSAVKSKLRNLPVSAKGGADFDISHSKIRAEDIDASKFKGDLITADHIEAIPGMVRGEYGSFYDEDDE